MHGMGCLEGGECHSLSPPDMGARNGSITTALKRLNRKCLSNRGGLFMVFAVECRDIATVCPLKDMSKVDWAKSAHPLLKY